MKDSGIVEGKSTTMEVGEGNLNWSGILEACRDSGVLWYIVEQEHFSRDPFDSIRISKENLRSMEVE